jgi:hypothetical protein
MQAGELFYDDEHHALRAVIEGAHGYKKTALHLWPDMRAESAYAKLKHAVNGTNGESLRFGQVLEVCRYNDRYDALYHACDELGHNRPNLKAPGEGRSKAIDAVAAATDVLGRALKVLEREQQSDSHSLKAVK